ncbi:rhomboid-like protein [Longispora albida]|uniref:rhomboid-like protein n=1 Tax=Longispora albida TaxID=203523 RepID=UPI00036E6EC1|nr:rhomboid-like protein [Longispora albida]
MALVFLGLVLAWYLLKALGRVWQPASEAVARLSPYTRRLHRWVMFAPATFAYVAVFTATTLVQFSAPPHLINVLTTMQSTNLAHLSDEPIRALATSAIWVAERGYGLGLYILVYATVVAWAERRYGTPRIIFVCLFGHVAGTLLTALAERHAIAAGHESELLRYTNDVGVSYMMVAGCAAAALLLRGWKQWLVIAGLVAGVLVPFVVTRSIWELGHLLATLCGLFAAWLSLLPAPAREVAGVPAKGVPMKKKEGHADAGAA